MSLEIDPYIFGKKIGTLLYENGHVYFEYDETFRVSGLEISPFNLPLNSTRLYSNPDDSSYYQGLPGVFHDSLPDKFGTKIIEKYFESKNIPSHELNILQKLMFVGNIEKVSTFSTLANEIEVNKDLCKRVAESHRLWI